jgi:hypothetical protein
VTAQLVEPLAPAHAQDISKRPILGIRLIPNVFRKPQNCFELSPHATWRERERSPSDGTRGVDEKASGARADVREVDGEQVGGRRGVGRDLGQDGEDEVVGECVQVVRPVGRPLPALAAGALTGDGRRHPLPLLPHQGILASAVTISGPAPRPHISLYLHRSRRRQRGRGERWGGKVKRPRGRARRPGARSGVPVGDQSRGLLYRSRSRAGGGGGRGRGASPSYRGIGVCSVFTAFNALPTAVSRGGADRMSAATANARPRRRRQAHQLKSINACCCGSLLFFSPPAFVG